VQSIAQFNMSLVPQETFGSPDAYGTALRAALADRIRGIKAPVSVNVAKQGHILGAGEKPESWEEMGIPAERIYYTEGGHSDMFNQVDWAHTLEFDWTA
jgi:hypothetical protein